MDTGRRFAFLNVVRVAPSKTEASHEIERDAMGYTARVRGGGEPPRIVFFLVQKCRSRISLTIKSSVLRVINELLLGFA